MSTDEYTPSDEDVYGVWTNYQCFRADDGYGPRGFERAAAEMDRYIARVRRDAAREALDGLARESMGAFKSPLAPPDPRSWAEMAGAVEWYRDTHYPEETP